MPLIRDFFPGGNTSVGFYSYYDYIIEKNANRIFIIKGGPGVGKSSLMKKIGNNIYNLGYDIEYHHCSSDNNSIDGLVIPKLKVAMIDGTAPHIVDPKNPGAVDEIINLGDYWDKEAMELNKEQILKVNNDVGKCFKRAYRYFKSAKPIIEDIIEKNSEAMDFGKINLMTNELISEIFMGRVLSDKKGKIRHLFGSAYTPNGHIDYTNSILKKSTKVYKILGDYGTGRTILFQKIYNKAIEYGMDVEVFHTPLIPEKIESIYIKDLKIGLTISEQYDEKKYPSMNLLEYINKQMIDYHKIDEDKTLLNSLIHKGIDNIKEAKKIHDDLEKYYINNINFDQMNELRKELVNRILKYNK